MNKQHRHIILILFSLAMFITACNTDPLPCNKYVEWVNKAGNGLTKQKTIQDLVFMCRYLPFEYILCTRYFNEDGEKSGEQATQAENAMIFLQFRIAESGHNQVLRHNISSEGEYEQRLSYYSFQVENDVYAIYGKDTLSCAFSHFDQGYDLSGEILLELAFEKKSKNTQQEDITLVFDDKILGCGRVKLQIDADDIKDIPELQKQHM